MLYSHNYFSGSRQEGDGADGGEMVAAMRPCLSTCLVSNIISDSEAECGFWWKKRRRDGEQRLELHESAVLLVLTAF